jgi:cytochrome c-type biogenesis protein CcmE
VSPTTTKSKKRGTYIAVGLCGVAIVAIIALTVVLSNNVVYFRTVSEAVASRSSDGDSRFRIAGEVVPGSVQETRSGVKFEITDGKKTAAVVHVGDPPSLFEDGAPVVCEGRWGAGAAFDSDRIMIRHGNEYEPPEVESEKSATTASKGALGVPVERTVDAA